MTMLKNTPHEQMITTIFKDKIVKIIDFDGLKQAITDLITNLTDRERIILELRFGLVNGSTKTLQQIGDSFGVTRERIRQLEKKALRKLKHRSRINKLLQCLEVSE